MNNKAKLLMSLVLTAILICVFAVCGSANTSGSCGENLKWELKNGVLSIIGEGEMTYFEVPQEAPWCFNEQITELNIEDGVTAIGGFGGLPALKRVNIPKTVTQIQPNAFRDCSELADISIPDGVTFIGENAFAECEKLININIPQSVTIIQKNAFYNTGYLNDEMNNVDGAFYLDNCLISIADEADKNFVIQNGTRMVADETFAFFENLESVVIPSSVEVIGDAAFFECENLEYAYYEGLKNEWEKVKVGVSNVALINNIWFTKDGIKWRLCEGILTVDGMDGMEGWTEKDIPWKDEKGKIKKLIVAEGITVIGISAFMDCTELEEISLPNSLNKIKAHAFNNCSKLSNVDIPVGVNIYYSAFRNCTGLKELIIPEGVRFIEYAAFAGCSGLEKVTLPKSLSQIDGLLFGNCTALKDIYLPEGIKIIGEMAFSGCTNLEKIVFPESLNLVKTGAFTGSGITDVYYNGTKRSWEKIQGSDLINAEIHFLKILGDADMDERVSVFDAVTILKYVAGIEELNPEQIALCDINCDNDLTVSDAVEVLKYVARLITDFQ